MDKIRELANQSNDMERNLIQDMIHNAADYVRAVVVMETAASNIAELDADEAREAKQSTDKARSIAHDAFASSVNVVNRICDKHNTSRIYTGSAERRAYGGFAMELVADIFANRH